VFKKYLAYIEAAKDRFELKRIIERILNDKLMSEDKGKEVKIDKAILLNKAEIKLRKFYRDAIINAISKKELKRIADELKDDKFIKRKGSLLGLALLRRLEIRGKI